MWKKEHREREAKLARKTKRDSSDMTDVEWAPVQQCERSAPGGDLREVVNGPALSPARGEA